MNPFAAESVLCLYTKTKLFCSHKMLKRIALHFIWIVRVFGYDLKNVGVHIPFFLAEHILRVL